MRSSLPFFFNGIILVFFEVDYSDELTCMFEL